MSIFIIENYYYEITPDLPWSSSGTTTITYYISSYNGENIPLWVLVNLTSGLMKVTTPNVSSNTDFKFVITSNVGGNGGVPKTIKITVVDCIASNWKSWVNPNGSVCGTWNEGFTLNSGLCSIISTTTQQNKTNDKIVNATSEALKISIQWITFIAIGLSWIVSMANFGSASNVWMLINQIQLFFLLFITGAYIPQDVENVIEGMKILIYPLNIEWFDDIKWYKSLINNFYFEWSNKILEKTQIRSESTVYNINFLVILLILIIILHLFILIIKIIFNKLSNPKICILFITITKSLILKIFVFLTFTYYVRLIIEMSQYLLISSIYEISLFKTREIFQIASLCTAFLVLLLFLSGMIIVVCLTWKGTQANNSEGMFYEFFRGLKQQRRFKAYNATLILRLALIVAILVNVVPISSMIAIGVCIFMQVTYLVYVSILRPFTEVQCNLIKIINEVYFSVCISWLLYFNSESTWTNTPVNIYMWLIASNWIATLWIWACKVF